MGICTITKLIVRRLTCLLLSSLRSVCHITGASALECCPLDSSLLYTLFRSRSSVLSEFCVKVYLISGLRRGGAPDVTWTIVAVDCWCHSMTCGCVCFAFSEFMLAAPDLMAGQFAGTSTMCKILQRAPFLSKIVSVSKLRGNSRLTV